MHRILALLLCFGQMAISHEAFCHDSSVSVLPGTFNLIGFDRTKHYVILDNNKIFKVLDARSAAIVAKWNIGTPIRVIPQDESRVYVLVNTNTGDSIPMKHRSHLPTKSSE
jgi:hypothetical protein